MQQHVVDNIRYVCKDTKWDKLKWTEQLNMYLSTMLQYLLTDTLIYSKLLHWWMSTLPFVTFRRPLYLFCFPQMECAVSWQYCEKHYVSHLWNDPWSISLLLHSRVSQPWNNARQYWVILMKCMPNNQYHYIFITCACLPFLLTTFKYSYPFYPNHNSLYG